MTKKKVYQQAVYKAIGGGGIKWPNTHLQHLTRQTMCQLSWWEAPSFREELLFRQQSNVHQTDLCADWVASRGVWLYNRLQVTSLLAHQDYRITHPCWTFSLLNAQLPLGCFFSQQPCLLPMEKISHSTERSHISFRCEYTRSTSIMWQKTWFHNHEGKNTSKSSTSIVLVHEPTCWTWRLGDDHLLLERRRN